MTEKQTSARAQGKEGSTAKAAPRTTFPVVGIGASAGGLEACQILLKALPDNLGMAYVFLPHLDPSRESAFREILARSTSMPVVDVERGMRIAPDTVYVIPRNCEMTISNGELIITERKLQRTVHLTVDIFLRSLAAELGRNAIGVVLSGTASDGTMGITAIKGEGGITFAQDNSAKYDGMPASASHRVRSISSCLLTVSPMSLRGSRAILTFPVRPSNWKPRWETPRNRRWRKCSACCYERRG